MRKALLVLLLLVAGCSDVTAPAQCTSCIPDPVGSEPVDTEPWVPVNRDRA